MCNGFFVEKSYYAFKGEVKSGNYGLLVEFYVENDDESLYIGLKNVLNNRENMVKYKENLLEYKFENSEIM